jgi:hypothetical protein
MHESVNRRMFLRALSATALTAFGSGSAKAFALRRPAQSGYRTRAILLGTAGGPSPKR